MKLLRPVRDGSGQLVAYSFYCPGCAPVADRASTHVFYVAGPMAWQFDGNMEAPTFSPSLLLYKPEHTDERGVRRPRETTCHLFLRGGVIEYCGDSKHELAGKSVPLQPPPWGESVDDGQDASGD